MMRKILKYIGIAVLGLILIWSAYVVLGGGGVGYNLGTGGTYLKDSG